MVRADELPLVLPVMGGQNLPRNARVRVKLGDIDEVTLDVMGTVLERLDALPESNEANEDAGDDEDDASAGPIAIAVDMTEGDGDAKPAGGDNPAP
jgi:exoribonuclease-2